MDRFKNYQNVNIKIIYKWYNGWRDTFRVKDNKMLNMMPWVEEEKFRFNYNFYRRKK
jgi:hypothetical protein